MRFGGTGWVRQRLDWRDVQYAPRPFAPHSAYDLSPDFPPVYDQGQTSSCTGNASCGAYHYLARMEGETDFVPSRLFTYYQGRLLEGDPGRDDGAEIRDVVKSLATDGAASESLWPFDPASITRKPPQAAYDQAKLHLALTYAAISDSLPAAQKRLHISSCLAHKTPVVFGISCFSGLDTDQCAQTGVVPMPGKNEQADGGHAIVIVGLDLTKGLYKFRNSWGPGWGDKGYGYLPTDYVENPNLASDFWAMFTVEKPK